MPRPITALPLDDWLDYCHVEQVNVDDGPELAFWLSVIVPRAQFSELADSSVHDEATVEMLDTGAHDALLDQILNRLGDDPNWDASAFYAGAPGTGEQVEPLLYVLEAALNQRVDEFIAELDGLYNSVTDGQVIQVEVHVASDHPAALTGIDDDHVRATQQVHCQGWVALIDHERHDHSAPDMIRSAALWALAVGGSASAYARTFPHGADVSELRSWVFEQGGIARF